MDAGAVGAAKVGQVHSAHVIPRPHDELRPVLPKGPAVGADEGAAGEVMALGIVETRGATGVIEASDVMCKTANVKVVKIQEIGGGYITVLVSGDVGSVSAAVSAGAEAAGRAGELTSQHIIPRPSSDVVDLYLR